MWFRKRKPFIEFSAETDGAHGVLLTVQMDGCIDFDIWSEREASLTEAIQRHKPNVVLIDILAVSERETMNSHMMVRHGHSFYQFLIYAAKDLRRIGTDRRIRILASNRTATFIKVRLQHEIEALWVFGGDVFSDPGKALSVSDTLVKKKRS